MGGFRTFLQDLDKGLGAASNTPQGDYAVSTIDAAQDRARKLRADQLTGLQDAAKTQQIKAAYFTDPKTGKPYAGFETQHTEAMNRFGDLAGQIWETQHPDPSKMGLAYRLGIRALNKMHLTNDMNSRVAKWQKGKAGFETTMAEGSAGLPEAMTPEGQAEAQKAADELRVAQARGTMREYASPDGKERNWFRPGDEPEGWNATQGISATKLQKASFLNPSTSQIEDGSFDPSSGKYRNAAGEEVANARPIVKPVNPHMQSGTSGGKNAFAYYNTDEKAWIDSTTGSKLTDFKPAPTFAQTGLYRIETVYDNEGNPHAALLNGRSGEMKNVSEGMVTPAQAKIVEAARTTAIDADTRLRVMDQNEQSALNGDQQAMLSLVANHIGMTLGAQKGARINQAVWNEAVESAPWLAKVAAKWGADGYLSGVTLTKGQIQQMVGLAKQRRQALWDAARQTATANGIDLDVPEFQEHPSGPVQQKNRAAQQKANTAQTAPEEWTRDANGKLVKK